jgi:hypothetical protein
MSNHSIHRAIDLASDERLLVERWLGRALANDETISVKASHSASLLGEVNFFDNKSLPDLAAAQGVEPINDIAQLAGGFPSDEDVDEFLMDIYSARK